MTDFRALCIELADAYLRTLEHINNSTWLGYEPSDDLLLQRTRAALAEPGPERPTDEELLEMMPQPFRDDLAIVSRMAAHGAGPDIKPGLFRVSLNTGALDYARAVLSRWGNHPGSPDSSPQPVPVSEQLPGPGDCDAEGRCWWGDAGDDEFVPSWRLCEQPDKSCFDHWLPHWALPVREKQDKR